MKDKNGIEIKCENCVNNGACTSENNCKMCPSESVVQYVFEPHREALEARIAELQEELQSDKYCYESWQTIKAEHEELKEDNKRLQGVIKETIVLNEKLSRENGELQAKLRERIISDFDIAKLVKPLVWEQPPYEDDMWYCSIEYNGLNLIDLFIVKDEYGYQLGYGGNVGFEPRQKTLEECKDFAQNWAVGFVRSTCGWDYEVGE